MGVLYILGAGCSKNYHQSKSNVPGVSPPLNGDFFKIAGKIIDHYDWASFFGSIIGLDHFVRDMNELFGYGNSETDTKVFDDDRLTLESVMNYFYARSKLIDYDSFSSPLFGGQHHRIRTLNELLAHVLVETMMGDNCELHRRLAGLCNRGDIVWNMNYDILMDNALFEAGKITESAYSMRFDYTLTHNSYHPTVDSASPVKIFKLHGSLNWVQCTICDRNLLLRDERFPIRLWKRIRDLSAECPKCGSGRYHGLERLIVPPAAAKEFDNVGIRYLWKAAFDTCKNVEKIVSIGFSFSPLDYELEMLLRSLVERHALSTKIPVTIVNPDGAGPASRFHSIFDKSKIIRVRSLASFVK